MPRPPGLVTVKIDPTTGKRAPAGEKNAIFETFRRGHVPPVEAQASTGAGNPGNANKGPKGQQGSGGGKGWVQKLYQ